MEKHTLIGIGEILWDEFPGSRQLGGAPANFAFHASQLGGHGSIISCVGDDPAGKEIRHLLEKRGIQCLLSVDPDHPTGRVSVTLDHDGIPSYIIHENASWDFLRFGPGFHEVAARADAVCFGSLAQRNPVSGKTIRQFIRATRNECLKLFDVNLRQHYYSKAILSDLLDLADVLKLNQDELKIIGKLFLRGNDETAQLEELISIFSLDLVVLTKGKNGSRLFAGKHRDSVYAPAPVEVMDSVGAGDSFSAVVAMGLLKGFDLDRINKTASRVAAFVCSKKGATPMLPDEIIQSMN